MGKKRLVVLSGAGMSQESGIKTFRDSDGMWEEYHIGDVATPEAWERNPQLVNNFYNQRRKQLFEVEPNAGHYGLAALEKDFDVRIITQNVDDLHERAGSSHVLHLHGELRKVRSTKDPKLIYELNGWKLDLDKTCELGSRLRPHIVWFGEPVPNMESAVEIVQKADAMVIIGTSLAVYPAAGLYHYLPKETPIFLIDPGNPAIELKKVTFIRKKASEGVKELTEILKDIS